MNEQHVESFYLWIDGVAEQIEHQLEVPYLEAIAIGLEFYLGQEPTEAFSEVLEQSLHKKAKELHIEKYEKEEIRKGLQLAILKGMKDGAQQQHLVTPDTVAIFIGYLVQKMLGSNKKTVRIFDPASGTANLLTAVVNQMGEVQSYGSEVDPLLIRLAVASANLQEIGVEYFHQDSLSPFLLEPVNVVVSDLPVGYYPDDVQADQYELKADQGHSYSHHLFIEQSLKYTKKGGYLFFVIPNFLFESDQADKLHNFLHKHAHVIGLLQLPASMFKSEQNAKSIFILQKKGEGTKAPKEALIAQLPSFKDAYATNNILKKINHWFETERFAE
ncbi:class I SAM-dependent methyltransferase [Radiobacillus kanasensis]|uniref:class I SAM-dependent methyltransferase n=1 Tax=Radiobacillus kanasensis TaxID=2844358 RepID=UPI001E3E5836|nr:class I SAM-dependent methyltransferase [Radiobacillus kanasensis]UFT98032.1 class I SAM-dependent methyltransferase [Radiobacillus kanasensis]